MTRGSWTKLRNVVLLCLLPLTQHVWTQQPISEGPSRVITKPTLKLIDQFGIMNSEDRSARLDLLFSEIMQTPGSVGYILLYCGKKCRYGEIEAHQRGIEIKTAVRRFDRSRIVVLNAGFRENFETEIWVAGGSEIPPKPSSTVNIRFVEFTRSTGREFEAYECCDDYSDIWKNLKP